MKSQYQQISNRLHAMINCERSGNSEWYSKHEEVIHDICKNEMPSGSGFDSGTTFDFDNSTPEKLIFKTSFHHMNDGGCYDGWTDHKVIVTPSLEFGFNIKVTGRDRNNIKDYIVEMFS
jgi:hypothetical protein